MSLEPVRRTYDRTLKAVDSLLLARLVRISGHAACYFSLFYFLLTSAKMMSPAMFSTDLLRALTAGVGSTTNKLFSDYFITRVTPAAFVFFIWPVIGVLQLVALVTSSLSPARPMTQSELASLAAANACAISWLFSASVSAPMHLPLQQALVLPGVPLFAGFPLRNPPPRSLSPSGRLYRLVFAVYSSFTTLAACLALIVELQYGGRVPLLGPELCGSLFLALSAFVLSAPRRNRPLASRLVGVLAFSGIVARRLGSGPLSAASAATLAGSVACLALAVAKALPRRLSDEEYEGAEKLF